MVDGILVVKKDKYWTSHDVVGKLRKLLNTKRIGHAGTLDPMATGVLVIGVGRATKLLQFLTANDKKYRATLKLGAATTTYDCDGEMTESKPYQNDLTAKDVVECLNSFIGDSKQMPPMYSAIKKNGIPLYQYARNNQEVEIEERDIHIDSLELISFENDLIVFDACVSKGTYIRSLCVDIANKLGYPGFMLDLHRETSGLFCYEDGYTLKEIEEGNYQFIPFDDVRLEMEKIVVEDGKWIIQGNKVKSDKEGRFAMYDKEGHLLAVYQSNGEGYLKCVRGLWS